MLQIICLAIVNESLDAANVPLMQTMMVTNNPHIPRVLYRGQHNQVTFQILLAFIIYARLVYRMQN